MKGKGKGYLSTQGKTAPAAVDASMSMKGASVNADAVRSATAMSQKQLGPRSA